MDPPRPTIMVEEDRLERVGDSSALAKLMNPRWDWGLIGFLIPHAEASAALSMSLLDEYSRQHPVAMLRSGWRKL